MTIPLRLLGVALASTLAFSSSAATQTKPAAPAVNERGAATKAFLDRIQEYLAFHKRVDATVPSLKQTDDPAQITRREAALGAAIIKHRPNAKEGDFFIKEYQPYVREIIADDFAKRSAEDLRAMIVELPKGVTVKVNSLYPTSLPLLSFPARLLKLLPELPPELEYRIVGRHLILRDVKANVVIDVMRNVFPMST